jgi:hypothetical protein
MVGRPPSRSLLTGTLLSGRSVPPEWHNVRQLIQVFDGDQAMAPVARIAKRRNFAGVNAAIDRPLGQPGPATGFVCSNELAQVPH